MDDITHVTNQGSDQLRSLVASICSSPARMSLSHVVKPRACAENDSIADAIHGVLAESWPTARMILASGRKTFVTGTMGDGYICTPIGSLTSELVQTRLLAGAQSGSNNNNTSTRLPLFGSSDGVGGVHNELVIVVDLDPMMSCSCATLMVLLTQRAGELHYSKQDQQRMHIITVSNDLLDTRIEKLWTPRMMPNSWAWPDTKTYMLEWARHGTRGDVPLNELCRLSGGIIQHISIEPEASLHQWNGVIRTIVQRVQSSDNKRHMIVCFPSWSRVYGLDSELGKVQGIHCEFFMEESWSQSRSGQSIAKAMKRVGSGIPSSSKVAYIVCLGNASPDTLARCAGSLSGWEMTVVLGTLVDSHYVEARHNHHPMLRPMRPCIEEQLDQLAWARLTDTKAMVLTTASGRESAMLFKHWGDLRIDHDTRKALFPGFEPKGRLARVENDQIPSFICSMAALGVVCDANAAASIGAMIMRHDAMLATSTALRYQGTLQDCGGGVSSTLRLALPQGMGSRRNSHALFVELVGEFGDDYTLAWIVCSSWTGQMSDDWYLAILVASALSVGLDALIDSGELDTVVEHMERGLDALVAMCTGPFAKLAGSGTVWLKLALMHRAAWVEDTFIGRQGMQLGVPASFPVTIRGPGDDEHIVNIEFEGVNALFLKAMDVARVIEKYTGQDYTNGVIKAWDMKATDETLRRLQRRMLSAFVTHLTQANPRTRSLHSIRSNAKILPRYKYIGAILSDAGRTLQPGTTQVFGAMTGIPRQIASVIDIGEWVYIPLGLVIEWHEDRHWGEEKMFQGLMSR